MPRMIYFDGPQPPVGQLWCSVCLMIVKQVTINAHKAAIDAAQRADDSQPPLRLDIERSVRIGGLELKPAVTRAVSTVVPQWGPLDVCWSHALGLELLPGGVAPATPQEAAMINQAAMLQRRKQS